MARGGDEDVGQVLADAAPQREGLGRRRRGMGRRRCRRSTSRCTPSRRRCKAASGIGRDVAGDIGGELGDRRRRRAVRSVSRR